MKAKQCVALPNEKYEQLCMAAGKVSRETFDRLIAFEARFRQWNDRINLVANSTLDDFWKRHVIDSAQLMWLGRGEKRWLDLGSGGGFPGLVVAFLLEPGAQITLVESNRKKTGFLGAIAGEFRLPVDILPIRIEDASQRVGAVDVVTARALTSLPNLLGMTTPWLGKGARGLFHKGREYRTEINESARNWLFDLVEHRSLTDPGSVILEISGLKAVQVSES